jgi:hypothetical protein
MGAGKVENELLAVLWAGGLALGGWVVKEVADIRPLKENVNHIRERVDALHDHLLGESREGPTKR